MHSYDIIKCMNSRDFFANLVNHRIIGKIAEPKKNRLWAESGHEAQQREKAGGCSPMGFGPVGGEAGLTAQWAGEALGCAIQAVNAG